MSRRKQPGHLFYSSKQDHLFTRHESVPESSRAQADSPSYELAYSDLDFLTRKELRGVRLQLELTKPDLILKEEGINHTIVVFGSARNPSMEKAQADLEHYQKEQAAKPGQPEIEAALRRAATAVRHATYYDKARELGAMLSSRSGNGGCPSLHVVTGGGPGIMQAANQGAADVGCKSIGLNIVLPHEQYPNPYITPKLCFQFHYFAIRKMHFLLRARALVAFPGGYGTLDELFETLTLIQTGKIAPMPVILFGTEYWQSLINFDLLVEEATISPDDIKLFQYTDSVEEAWQIIRDSLEH